MQGSFAYFYDNTKRKDGTYGLTEDAYPTNKNLCSIAATGFALGAFVLGVEYKYITHKEGEKIITEMLGVLETIPHKNGFYYHFYDADDYEKDLDMEVSTIDSAILFMGLIVVSSYFGGEIAKRADALVTRAEWCYFADPNTNSFFMAERHNERFAHWDHYAEQLMIFVLAAAEGNSCGVAKKYYQNMLKPRGIYKDISYIYTPTGSLFVHQFSHAFIDFRGRTDDEGIDWFLNSVNAARAAHAYAVDHPSKSYNAKSWGLSACDTRDGYVGGFGNPPRYENKYLPKDNGTVPPYAAVASVVFTPKESLDALDYYYAQGDLTGKYGLYESFNRDQGWVLHKYLGIDKGITMLMLANYEKEIIWKLTMKHPLINKGLENLGIIERGK